MRLPDELKVKAQFGILTWKDFKEYYGNNKNLAIYEIGKFERKNILRIEAEKVDDVLTITDDTKIICVEENARIILNFIKKKKTHTSILSKNLQRKKEYHLLMSIK